MRRIVGASPRIWRAVKAAIATTALLVAVFGYSITAAVVSSGDPAADSASAASRLSIYLTLVAGNAMALAGFLVFHYRRIRRTGIRKTNVFTALGVYREFAGLLLALALVGIVLDRYFPLVPDISDHLLYFIVGLSSVTVLLRGGAFVIEFFRPGFLEADMYLWPWQQLAESLREAVKEKGGES